MHSDFFALERGVRQGDPLSSYLFIAAVEILAIAIRTNNNIRGLSIGDQEYKLVQYADDTTGILKDEESLKVFLDVLKSYEKVSGLKINISKSECIGGGSGIIGSLLFIIPFIFSELFIIPYHCSIFIIPFRVCRATLVASTLQFHQLCISQSHTVLAKDRSKYVYRRNSGVAD